MATPLTNYGTHDLIYSYMLANRYRSPWIYDPSGATLAEPDIWTILLNDTDIRAMRQQRNQSIVRPWRVSPSQHSASKNLGQAQSDASKSVAAICHEGLSYIDRFDAARFTLSDAFYLGRNYLEIQFEEQFISLDGSPEMSWFIPKRLKHVDRRRIHWVPEWTDTKSGRVKSGISLEMFDTNSMTWIKLSPDSRRRLIEYTWEDTEDRIGHGLGVLECLFYTHYYASGTVKKLVEGVDRMANGFLIGHLDSLRSASTDMSNATLTTTMRDMLQKMRSEHVAVLGDNDKIELLEMSGTGFNAALELRRYFVESAARLCSGALRQSGHSVGGFGAKAAAVEEGDTAEAYYQFGRGDMDAVLDRDLLGSFLYFNAANFESIGFAHAKRPRFTSEQTKKQNPQERLETLKALNTLVPVLARELYEAAEATIPAPDDEVVDKAEPAGAGGFGGSPFGEENGEKPEEEQDSQAENEDETASGWGKMSFSPSEHPRHNKGKAEGGQFAPKSGQGGGTPKSGQGGGGTQQSGQGGGTQQNPLYKIEKGMDDPSSPGTTSKLMAFTIKISGHLAAAKAGDRVAESSLINRLGSLRASIAFDKLTPDVMNATREAVAYLRSTGRKVDFSNPDPRLWITTRSGQARELEPA